MKTGLFLSTRSKVAESGSSSTSFDPGTSNIFMAHPRTPPSVASGPKWLGGAGEPDQRPVAAWLGVNSLRVCRRHVAQDLHLRLDHAVCLRVCAADGPPATLDHRRFADRLFPVVDDLFQEAIEIRIERLHLRRIADEIRWHLPALLLRDRARPCSERQRLPSRPCPGTRPAPCRHARAAWCPRPSDLDWRHTRPPPEPGGRRSNP